MLILYTIPFIAIAALFFEARYEAAARKRQGPLRQYGTAEKAARKRGGSSRP
jgi:hypothetical protein